MEWFSWELVAALIAIGYAGHMDLRVRRLEVDNCKKAKQIEWLQSECRSLRTLTAPTLEDPARPFAAR